MSEQKIGLFGGTFNPIHFGHINSILTVSKKIPLDKVVVVPSNQNPLKGPVEGPTAEQRLEMVRKGLSDFSDTIDIDDGEISRGGKSYTVETIRKYVKEPLTDEFYFIMGMDSFETFDQWKDYVEIVSKCNLVVTSRPGLNWPTSIEELPKGLQPLVGKFKPYEISLKTGHDIYFVSLEDIAISASEIRKKIRLGQKTDKFLPLPVEDYIKENDVYPKITEKISDYEEFTRFCANIVHDKKGILTKGFDLRELNGPTEYTLIVSGTSTRHTSSLAEHVLTRVKEEYGTYPLSIEGQQEGRWILLDYGSLMVHIFYDFVRQEYRLEELWAKGQELDLNLPKI
jgi:nicotinate-nucleotide adenylyltransferase